MEYLPVLHIDLTSKRGLEELIGFANHCGIVEVTDAVSELHLLEDDLEDELREEYEETIRSLRY